MLNSLQNSANLLLLIRIAVTDQEITDFLDQHQLSKNRSARYLVEHLIVSHLLMSLTQLIPNNTDQQQFLALMNTKGLDSNQLIKWLDSCNKECAPTLKQVGARVLFSLAEPL